MEPIKKKEPVKKKWIFGYLHDNGEIEIVCDNLMTEEEFLNDEYNSDDKYKYFRIDPKLIEKIKIETKIVKEA